MKRIPQSTQKKPHFYRPFYSNNYRGVGNLPTFTSISPNNTSSELEFEQEMGLASQAFARVSEASTQSLFVSAGLIPATLLVLAVILNVLRQLLFKDPKTPPLVFYWFPIIGSMITYGINPYDFFFKNRKKARSV